MKIAMYALLAGFLLVIAAAKFSYGVSTDIGDDPQNKAWSRSTMDFVAWNNEEWTARIHEGKFHLVPQNETDWSRHSNASIAFRDWDGIAWQAKIDGDMFLLARDGDWLEKIERVDALRYRDWAGSNQLRTVADLDR